MPVFVRRQGLHKAGALFGGLAFGAADEAGGLEHAVSGGRGHGGRVRIEHHECQAAVALQRMCQGIADDGLLLMRLQPVVARHRGVVLVGFAVAVAPAGEFARAEFQPGQQAGKGDFGERVHAFEKVYRRVAFIMGSPLAVQGSPSSFFVRTSSSVTAAMTSSFLLSLASRCSIL